MSASASNCLVSAGGDGSMHILVNTILKSKVNERYQLCLGAIGLGSSNDFLKPFGACLHGIPVRIDYNGPCIAHDVGFVTYLNEDNEWREKYFVVNASFGLTAEANWYFNHPGGVLKWLKKVNTTSAILYTAFRTLIRHQNFSSRIGFNHYRMAVPVSNINLLKLPFVSGSFRYNQNLLPDDGRLGLNACLGMNKAELLGTLYRLGCGRFDANNKRVTESVDRFHLCAPAPVVFECDGETDKVKEVRITLLPKAIHILKA
jgi:diacylglycerol kinase family enzyme